MPLARIRHHIRGVEQGRGRYRAKLLCSMPKFNSRCQLIWRGPGANSCSNVVKRPIRILAHGRARNPTLSGDEISWRHRLPDLAA